MKKDSMEGEWSLLQNQFDSYEKFSLLIKLVNTGILSIAYFSDRLSVFVVLILLVLWGQDAIWKTFQSRIETRLLTIEKYLLDSAEEQACQFNSQYRKNRKGGVALIGEYFRQAIRPTIAFPHALLVLILAVDLLV